MNTETIRILITGGTFDKEYDEIGGQLFFRESHVQEMLNLGRSQVQVAMERLFMIDSLEMTDEHRKTIFEACQNCSESKILITHGTDSMEKTAKTLGEAKFSKTIVLTGAMIPYKFGSSDGLFNLGAALAFVQCLPTGVYIAMNGLCFPHNNVTKDRSTGRFTKGAKDL